MKRFIKVRKVTRHIIDTHCLIDNNKVRKTYKHAQYLKDSRSMMQWYTNQLDIELRERT